MNNSSVTLSFDNQAMSEFLIKRRDQEEECQRLHFLLSDLREEKDKARAEKERVKAELEESRKTKQVPYKKHHFTFQSK